MCMTARIQLWFLSFFHSILNQRTNLLYYYVVH
uniref:Uncharacterized protein n=1 Tax=Anguilla anguilla TaxID=7936 RepID=A0A0E9XXU4_ANGAN